MTHPRLCRWAGAATSRECLTITVARGMAFDFIQPDRPVENACVESFNRHLRDECLNVHGFGTLAEPKSIIGAWRKDYNEKFSARVLRWSDAAR